MVEAIRKTIAIGCQGGGMHAAFSVGALTKILETAALPQCGFKLVGLSGTSAGALCALMTWYGLAPKRTSEGSPSEAASTLNEFWNKFVAETRGETLLNSLTFGAFKLTETEIPLLGLSAGTVGINPRGAVYRAIEACLPILGVRREYFDLDHLLKLSCPEFSQIRWNHNDTPRLLIGASEVVNGYETVFDSELRKANKAESRAEPIRWRQRLPLSLAGVAASGTLPSVRQAQHIKGSGYYWDGLYSQNPPIRDFVEDRREAPDEIWILRINPQQWPSLPQNLGEIRDRENELMGNLSLHKDLDFIQKVNQFQEQVLKIIDGAYSEDKKAGIDEGTKAQIDAAVKALRPSIEKQVVVRTIKMRQQTCDELQYSSKFDRSLEFLDKLRAEGYEVATEWLGTWNTPDEECYPRDAGYKAD